ncbi:hypothetical protein [Oceanobacillus massiliensis]|uniref:hypothetical protein n=1 Tax=Oceanobacillus massiliensis TaxID=1465765 RepID=UPI000287EDB7|nr:hypothetical protein [Oceanobacillus massiliensis]
MDEYKKIHLLSQELIPIIDELDIKPKQIVLDHIEDCDACKSLYSNVFDFDNNFPEPEYSKGVEIKPLKKLAQFNTGLKLLLIAVRVIILFYIFYSSFHYIALESSREMIIASFQAGVFLFYLPAAVFLLVFTFTFFSKRWLWISLAADVVIVLLFGNILQFLL